MRLASFSAFFLAEASATSQALARYGVRQSVSRASAWFMASVGCGMQGYSHTIEFASPAFFAAFGIVAIEQAAVRAIGPAMAMRLVAFCVLNLFA